MTTFLTLMKKFQFEFQEKKNQKIFFCNGNRQGSKTSRKKPTKNKNPQQQIAGDEFFIIF